jgi:hypothetical protein
MLLESSLQLLTHTFKECFFNSLNLHHVNLISIKRYNKRSAEPTAPRSKNPQPSFLNDTISHEFSDLPQTPNGSNNVNKVSVLALVAT